MALRSYLLDRVDDSLSQSVRYVPRPVLHGGRVRPGHDPDRDGDHFAPRSFLAAVYGTDGTLVPIGGGGLAVEDADAPKLPAVDDVPRVASDVASRRGDGQWRALARQLRGGRLPHPRRAPHHQERPRLSIGRHWWRPTAAGSASRAWRGRAPCSPCGCRRARPSVQADSQAPLRRWVEKKRRIRAHASSADGSW